MEPGGCWARSKNAIHFVSLLRTSGHSRWNILREILSIRCTVPIDLGWKEIVSLFSCLGKWTPMQLGFSSLLNTAGLKKWSRGFTSETRNQLFFIWFRKTGLKTCLHRKLHFHEEFLLCEIAFLVWSVLVKSIWIFRRCALKKDCQLVTITLFAALPPEGVLLLES